MRKNKKILFIIILSLFFSLSLLLLHGCGGGQVNAPGSPPTSPIPSSPSTTTIPSPPTPTPTPVPTQTINPPPPGTPGGDGPGPIIFNVVPPNL